MNSHDNLNDKIGQLEKECLQAVQEARDSTELTNVENRFVSKKGLLSECLKSLRDLPAEDRPKVGQVANAARGRIEDAIQKKKNLFETESLNKKLLSEKIDVTLPHSGSPVGSLHPISKILDEVVSIFQRLGFDLATGPEVEREFYNFDALNMLEDHPARDMQDTFYLPGNAIPGKGRSVLRTHTSSVQIRTMLKRKPPIRIISSGAVFRSDFDLTHTPMFHQVEGLYVNEKVSFSELKGCLLFFAKEMFGGHTKVRLRPSFFPFVEPGAEVDVTCFLCKGQGCRICKQSGWVEILGAGMVHPAVFKAVGYDPEVTTGFAFGMGIERIAILKYGIPDLRMLFENDIRFLSQFRGL
ncbi:MAG: phenylalanine--tRNA ligase subunit alpha [Bacteriovoracia bacterium]